MSFPDPPPSAQDRLLAIHNTNGMPKTTPSSWPKRTLTTYTLAVSNPSIVHRRSEQSITASEDYYSLSPSSSSSTYQPRHINDPAYSEATIIRYSTPPSRLRTPAHSRDNLNQYSRLNQVDDGNSNGAALRGLGQRRQSVDSSSSRERNPIAMPAPLNFRADGGIRRKPVPSTVMENPHSPTQGESSIIADRSHFGSPPTPGPHDEQYVRFALDQLTRDEEVRGSRRYADADRGSSSNPLYPVTGGLSNHRVSQDPTAPVRSNEGRRSAPAGVPPLNTRHRSKAEQILGEDPTLSDEPGSPTVPTRSPRRKSTPQYLGREPLASPQGPEVFLPCAADASRPLDFLPGILRPAQLGIFIALLTLYLAALLFVAIWSLVNTGLWSYTGFGNGRYFIFNYLPTLLGTVLLLWLFQIQIAVTRISPFLALSSQTQHTRDEGADLPLYQTNFLVPSSFQHFRAGQTMLGVFALVAWLQVFTLPLLASAFNVYYLGAAEQGDWRWIATQGVIWPVIALYAFLLIATVALLVHLLRLRETGMKWDPRSLADLMVLLERSNALAEDAELGAETARVGLWRTSHRPNEVFHTYGLAGREVRKYSLEDGRITEKPTQQQNGGVLSDIESQRPDTAISHEKEPERESDEAMLPRRASSSSSLSINSMIALPWYLRPVFTSLWAISAVVLLLAFLVVSYLPSTRVAAGFNPSIPAPVSRLGYSGTNFLYSFIPAVIGELCLLTWLSFDLAHRRLAPFFGLLSKFEGETAERSLLLSYHADLPFHAPLVAAANAHYRTAWIAVVTLLAATLPTLGGGVFWAQFFIPTQSILISAHMPAFYALTVFFTLYALSHLLLLPISHAERRLAHSSSSDHNPALTFADVLSLVRHSRILDDVAFHSPASKIDLVTRLLSAPVGASLGGRESRLGEAGVSLTSLADSIRGFGDARQRALGGLGVMEVPRYALGRFTGRNGKEYGGIGRVKS